MADDTLDDIKERVRVEKELLKDMSKSISYRKEELDLEKKLFETVSKESDLYKDASVYREKFIDLERSKLSILNDEIKILEEIALLDKKRVVDQEEANILSVRRKELEKKVGEFSEERLKKVLNEKKAQENIVLSLDKQKEAQVNLDTQLSKSIAGLTGVSDAWKQTTAGAFAHNTAINGLGSSFSTFGENLAKNFTISNILGSSLMKMQEMTIKLAHEQDSANSSFVAATGVQKEYRTTIADTFFEFRSFGVDSEEASKALSGLHNKLSQFGSLSANQKKELGGLGGMMTSVGVSSESFADSIQILNKGFGMSAPAAGKLVKQFVELGGAGKAPAEVIADFTANANHLSRYSGPKMVKVFTNLTEASAKLGVGMSELVGIAEQFDTFDSAAKSVSNLNALLGGDYLNTIDLMNASADEQIQMLRGVMLQSGKSWDSMNKFEKMAIASAAGISDMATANKMFGRSSQTDLERERMEKLEKAAKDAQTVLQKLQMAFYTFAVRMEPVIDLLGDVLDSFMKFDDMVRAKFKWIGAGGIFTAIFGAFALVKWVIPFFSSVAGMVGKLAGGVAALASGAAGAVGAAGTAGAAGAASAGKMSAQATSIAALGVAFAGLGVGVGSAAYGISFLSNSLKGLEGEQLSALKEILIGFVATIYLFAAAIIVLGLAGTATWPGILALGGAFLMLGAGVALAAYGVSILVDSFNAMTPEKMALMKDAIAEVGITIGSFAAALLALANPVGILALSSVAAGIGAISVAIYSIDLETLKALESVLKSISAIDTSKDIKIEKTFKTIAESINSVDAEKGRANHINSVDTEKGRAIASAGQKFKPLPFSSPVPNAPSASESSQKASPSISKKSEGQTPRNLEITIPFILDGREMKRFILDVVNDEVRIRKND